LGEGVEARPITTREGYDRWAPFYDEPGNMLLEIEQPIGREILDDLPVGVALDVACGTGRHTRIWRTAVAKWLSASSVAWVVSRQDGLARVSEQLTY